MAPWRSCSRSRRRGAYGASRTRAGGACCGPPRALLALQWSIGLALLPLTAAFFDEVSLAGPLVNLVAIPLFNLVLVPLTLLATLLLQVDALAATAAPAVLLVVGWLAAHTVAILHSVAAAPWASLAVPQAPPVALALAACGVVFALCARPLPARRLAWLAVLPMFFPARDVPAPGAARVIVLDVGQGLAVSVATHAHRLLFDAGPSFRSGFDSGDDIVLPALAASGPPGLDRLIVSHADNDHAGGAAAVLAAFPEADVLKGPDVALPLGARLRARRALGVGWRAFRDPASRERLRARAATRARACSR